MIQVVKKPIITEKAMSRTHEGQYVFECHPDANKIEIKRNIEEMFEVKVRDVRTLRVKGKKKVRMTKRGIMRGTTNLRKKAYITLMEGHEIELVSGSSDS